MTSRAQDPLDPFAPQYKLSSPEETGTADSTESDQDKSVDQLLEEAARLLELEERPLDARTKLLTAMQKSPGDYRPYMLLSGYYMDVVGHFKLSLRYARRSLQLFISNAGQPPYSDLLTAYQHGHLLYLLSQVRLNLDDYQGALDTLDEYASWGYYRDWYAGSRAWVLMKLGRLDEAIKVARMGILAGSEPGRIYNMLGILLSMTGKRTESLDVLDRATRWELSMGRDGRPATPLNNAGEVYDEIFEERDAETSWLKATSLPDGCEHVLPSLNLALLYMDQNRAADAKKAMDNFESCMAQYPLRNGEEHRALVHLARGRIALAAGQPDEAVSHMEDALERRQWFGKIGTSQEDLQTAAMISLAQALRARNNRLRTRVSASFPAAFMTFKERILSEIRAGWLMRRARQILSEDLKDFEDIYIRNTDSLLDYPSLGEVLARFPLRLAVRRIEREAAKDDRRQADVYYRAYLIECRFVRGSRREALQQLDLLLPELRDGLDESLKIHLLLMKLGAFRPDGEAYSRLAKRIFSLSRAALRNGGYSLPVNYQTSLSDDPIRSYLKGSAFYTDNSVEHSFRIRSSFADGAFVLEFSEAESGQGRITVKASDAKEAFNRLMDEVFSVAL